MLTNAFELYQMCILLHKPIDSLSNFSPLLCKVIFWLVFLIFARNFLSLKMLYNKALSITIDPFGSFNCSGTCWLRYVPFRSFFSSVVLSSFGLLSFLFFLSSPATYTKPTWLSSPKLVIHVSPTTCSRLVPWSSLSLLFLEGYLLL